MPRSTRRARWRPLAFAFAFTLAGGLLQVARAAPAQFLSVGDPLESELRVLDLFPSAASGGRIALPHFYTRPFQFRELEAGPPGAPSRVTAISLARLERVLGRNAREDWPIDTLHRATPLLYEHGAPDERLEFSAGLEGGATFDRDTTVALEATGLHMRGAVVLDHWLFYSHVVIGHFAGAPTFADPVVANTDITTLTEETYVATGAENGSWGVQFGRDRWHWGPGEEGSLLLSQTSAPITGLAMRGRLASLRLDGIALSATLDAAAGEQLAAHRLEWQPHERLRLGLSEAARYHASNWSPLYVIGIIPYAVVQRLLVQDSPDSSAALRNNVMFGLDAAWRLSDGSRVWGELLVDDLHSKTSANPDKIAWQLGWNGAGMIGDQRLTWGGEYTRVWRYVYTSFFGRTFEAQGRPLGYPEGPDSERMRVHVEWDPSVDWQFSSRVALTHHGEGTLDDAFVPGSPKTSASQFLGVIETTREAEFGARWWPAGGVDLGVAGGWRWVDDAGHVAGAPHDGAYGRVEFRLTR
jgi:hypothetical protein